MVYFKRFQIRIQFYMELRNKKKCIIIIPIYSESMTVDEKKSFVNSIKILSNYDIALVTYKELNIDFYKRLAEQEKVNIHVEYFSKYYFKSVATYNALCLNKTFYERFLHYKYMLICQLDVWIFRDELNDWCDKEYDYIGAPIFWEIKKNIFSSDMCGVGNGGLSLRRIRYCIDILNLNPSRKYLRTSFLIKQYRCYCKYNVKFNKWYMKLYALCICILKICGYHNTLNYHLNCVKTNEDSIFGVFAKGTLGIKANIPHCLEAMKFSFEVHPDLLYKLNDNKLPFGCHAYKKWEYKNFWSKYIN